MILSTPEDHPNTQQQRLFNETLWIGVAVDDVLARDLQGVTAQDLRDRLILTLDQSHRLSRIVYALAAECGGVVSDEYEGTTLDSIVLMAASGVGVAVLPDLYARRQGIYRDEVRLRPLKIPSANRDIALLTRRGDSDLPGHAILTDTLRDVARGMGLTVLVD